MNLPLIFSADLEEDEREAGADCTDSGAREVVEQVDEEDSLLGVEVSISSFQLLDFTIGANPPAVEFGLLKFDCWF